MRSRAARTRRRGGEACAHARVVVLQRMFLAEKSGPCPLFSFQGHDIARPASRALGFPERYWSSGSRPRSQRPGSSATRPERENVETDPKLLRIWEIAEPVALEAGLELVDIEHRREGHGTVLRLLLDRPGGVSIDALATISREISDLLDVHAETVPGTFTLEVSSPGIYRPLTRPAHFTAHVGKRVHVRTRVPVSERSSFRGTLESATDDGIVVVTGSDRHEIPFSAISRANYQHEFPAPGGKRQPGRRAESRPRGRSRATRE